MSSQLTSFESINRIATFLVDEAEFNHLSIVDRSLKKIFFPLAAQNVNGHILLDEDARNELSRDLLSMNQGALRARYGEQYPAFGDSSDIEFRYTTDTLFQVLKSINFYLYQCSEGAVPASQLFQALERVKHLIEAQIINQLPGYEAAVWG